MEQITMSVEDFKKSMDSAFYGGAGIISIAGIMHLEGDGLKDFIEKGFEGLYKGCLEKLQQSQQEKLQ